MNEKDWLETATKKILFRPDRKAVRRELEAHLEDLRDASGLEEDAALRAMGDPAEIAEELGRLHRPWLGYLWRLSQFALAGAAVMYCLLLVLLAVRPSNYWLLPGRALYHYLTWESSTVKAPYLLEAREVPCSETIETGGYTIRAERAVLRELDEEGTRQMYVDLDITSSRWEEPLELWYAVSGGRANTGTMDHFDLWDKSVSWGFWQKAQLVIEDLPEDVEWVEVDLGHGQLRRTLHIDLTGEAET